MEATLANKLVEVNEQGYMLDMRQWDEGIARSIAAEEGIERLPSRS